MTTDQTTAMTETRGLGLRLRGVVGHRAVWPLLALAVILIVDGFISPGFFTVRIVQGRLFGSVIDIFYRAVRRRCSRSAWRWSSGRRASIFRSVR